jgi:cysteine desulfurase
MSGPNRLSYLDNNATTSVAPECVDIVVACMRESFGNPSSQHRLGEQAKRLVNEARSLVAGLLGALPAEIVFTGGGTESNHLAILAALAMHPDKHHIVTSVVEHPSTLLLLRHLESQGMRVSYLAVDRHGQLDLAELERSLTPATVLVSLMWANNETGVLFPIEEAARLTKAKGALFHTDAVQAVGKVPIDLGRIPVDLLSLSGHKLHAPKGAGALYTRKGLKWPPLFFGHQERGRRGGTEDVPAIAGLGVAAALAVEAMEAGEIRIERLRDRLEAGVRSCLPHAAINGAGSARIANTSSICFGNLSGEAILHQLDQAGVCASAGAACTAGGSEPSHVLTAMGLARGATLASLRFSLSRYTSEADIDQLLEALPGILRRQSIDAA